MGDVWLTLGLLLGSLSVCTAQSHPSLLLMPYDTTLNVSYTVNDAGCIVNGEHFKQEEIFSLTDSPDTKCLDFLCLKDRVTISHLSGCFDGKNCRTGLFAHSCNNYLCSVGGTVKQQQLTLSVTKKLEILTPHRCMIYGSEQCYELNVWHYLEKKRCRCREYNLVECRKLPSKFQGPAIMNYQT